MLKKVVKRSMLMQLNMRLLETITKENVDTITEDIASIEIGVNSITQNIFVKCIWTVENVRSKTVLIDTQRCVSFGPKVNLAASEKLPVTSFM